MMVHITFNSMEARNLVSNRLFRMDSKLPEELTRYYRDNNLNQPSSIKYDNKINPNEGIEPNHENKEKGVIDLTTL